MLESLQQVGVATCRCRKTVALFAYLSVRNLYSVRIGEFTVFLEARGGGRDLEPCT